MRESVWQLCHEDWLKDSVFRPDKRRPRESMEAVIKYLRVLLGQNWDVSFGVSKAIFFFFNN